jgi:hypothetical protein
LYAKWYDGVIVTTAAGWSNALSAIRSGGDGSDGDPITYNIKIKGNVSVTGSSDTSTSLGSVQYVEVTLEGSGTLSLSSNGSILTIGSNQKLIIDSEDLTLQGLSTNNRSLVYVDSYGTLELKNGTISGNRYYTTSSSSPYGGGVYVGSGTFTMSGGTISGNTSSSSASPSSYAYSFGGGVFVNNGSFNKTGGGIIYGNNEGSNSNTVIRNSSTAVASYGRAVFWNSSSRYRSTTLGEDDDISTSVTTSPPWNQ